MEMTKEEKRIYLEYHKARSEHRAPVGIFRASDGLVYIAYWERESPGCYISGQGGIVWHFAAASDELAKAAGV